MLKNNKKKFTNKNHLVNHSINIFSWRDSSNIYSQEQLLKNKNQQKEPLLCDILNTIL